MESKEFKQFRKKLKKTQAQMAQLLGVSPSPVSHIEQAMESGPLTRQQRRAIRK